MNTAIHHYPFALRENLGIPPPRKKPRIEITSDETRATFKLNWSYSENGATDPQPEEEVCTFMGPALTREAGKGQDSSWVKSLKMATEIFKNEGYSLVIPDEFEDEMEYFEDCEDVEMKKGNDAPILIAVHCGWLSIRSPNEAVSQIIKDKVSGRHFVLASLDHKETELFQDGDYTCTCVTGNNRESASTSIGTKFILKFKNKIIAKALCSYHNGEMDIPGPAIELLETAVEWREHGYAQMLLEAMEPHFRSIFQEVLASGPVKLNVTYVTNCGASHWFQNTGGFEDMDGMGEELAKYL